jgi:hypothetical protein
MKFSGFKSLWMRFLLCTMGRSRYFSGTFILLDRVDLPVYFSERGYQIAENRRGGFLTELHVVDQCVHDVFFEAFRNLDKVPASVPLAVHKMRWVGSQLLPQTSLVRSKAWVKIRVKW